MKPKTKLEKEVCGYHLPHDLTPAQVKWALSLSNAENTRKFRGRNCDIVHFSIVTTHNGWQVIRQYYLYAYYAYKKLKNYWIGEVMQTWLKDGKFVYMRRPVQGLCYITDAWCFGSEMSIKRYSSRNLGNPYDMMNLYCKDYKLVRVQKKYRYIPKEAYLVYGLPLLYKAINASKYCETLMRQDFDCFKWCVKRGFAFEREKMEAIKIAKRYGYDYTHFLWADMVDNLHFLGKDLHNPKLVCPDNIQEAHDKWSKMAANKRIRMTSGLVKARMIKEERARLEHEELLARIRKEKEEREKALVNLYPKERKQFFGLVIAENEIEIKVLQSVREFFEEGKEMSHCVFSNAYYDVEKRPNCLILSAKVNGQRMETIEVDLSDFTIEQSRGKHNMDSPYHERIVRLMESNMGKIKRICHRKAV